MSPLDPGSAEDALGAAQSAASQTDLVVALRRFADALSMQRFTLFDLTGALGGVVAAVYHDAPVHLAAEITDLARAQQDPVVQMARVRRYIPFTWCLGMPMYAGSYYERHGSEGYRLNGLVCGI